ncbi:CopD family protein [Pleionea sediminis]|uniref:CopD family protein n=1 Tax=Pleionea sediminis TaxID=2569479 RepID=UPI001184DCB0|nr:CopD family protein [Pleionea sediminis]
MQFLIEYSLWLKALHLIFIVSWFAGIFYLPRIFVNIQLTDSQEVKDHLNIMARKLYRFITPFMVLTIIFGTLLTIVSWGYLKAAGWFHTKMVLIALLVAYHFVCGHYRKLLEENKCNKSHVFFRYFNEFPVLVLFAAVILAVVKPY